MLPVLLRPTWLSLKRHWSGNKRIDSKRGRDIILFSFGFAVAYLLYSGTVWALGKMNQNPLFVSISVGDFFSVFFLVLFAMLFIASILASLGTLFLSEDLELVLASPVSSWRLFLGKFCYVYISCAWMPLIFISPVLLGFGVVYQASWAAYLLSFVLMFACFAIPTSLGMVVAVALVLLIPVYRLREMMIVVLFSFLAVVYMVAQNFSLGLDSLQSAREFARLFTLITMPSLYWLPSNWLASAYEELIQHARIGWEIYALEICSCAGACLSLAYLCVTAFEDRAYSMAKNKRAGRRREPNWISFAMHGIGQKFSPQFRAVFGKDLRVMSRDMAQAVQILLLLTIALVYLYHMRIFAAVRTVGGEGVSWWQAFMFTGNVCMGAFITAAICTRFVYPCISLEGRSYWVLQCAPLTISDFMRIKFRSWLFPLILVSAVFHISGAVVIGAPVVMVIVSGIASVIMCYGIVGLAIGLGACFAQFDWEHSSQLAAGLGSLIFMLSAVLLIFFDMLPAGLLLFKRGEETIIADPLVFTAAVVDLLLIAALNIGVARSVMDKGRQALTLS